MVFHTYQVPVKIVQTQARLYPGRHTLLMYAWMLYMDSCLMNQGSAQTAGIRSHLTACTFAGKILGYSSMTILCLHSGYAGILA